MLAQNEGLQTCSNNVSDTVCIINISEGLRYAYKLQIPWASEVCRHKNTQGSDTPKTHT